LVMMSSRADWCSSRDVRSSGNTGSTVWVRGDPREVLPSSLLQGNLEFSSDPGDTVYRTLGLCN
jgi:hypothetical protein